MSTKLLLIKDVEDLGHSGDLVSVAPGYARNWLVPQRLAVVADSNTIRKRAKLQEERQKQALVDRKDAEEQAKALAEMTLEVVVKLDPEGHMYGSVSALDIWHLIQEKGLELSKKAIHLPHAIKETGVHSVELGLKEGVPATVTVKIISEEQAEKMAE